MCFFWYCFVLRAILRISRFFFSSSFFKILFSSSRLSMSSLNRSEGYSLCFVLCLAMAFNLTFSSMISAICAFPEFAWFGVVMCFEGGFGD